MIERRDATDEAMQRAAGELPSGWVIEIRLERDAGTVYLFNDDGNGVDFDCDSDSMADRISQAVDEARRSVG